MIVDDLDLIGAVRTPQEADPPLSVDPDAMLAHAVSRERFQPVAWQCGQIRQRLRRSEAIQPFDRLPADGLEAARRAALIKRLRLPACEAPDHSRQSTIRIVLRQP
jgi:hypothetical protein